MGITSQRPTERPRPKVVRPYQQPATPSPRPPSVIDVMQDKADRNTERCLEKFIANERETINKAEDSGFLGMEARIKAVGERKMLAKLAAWLRERRRARAMT